MSDKQDKELWESLHDESGLEDPDTELKDYLLACQVLRVKRDECAKYARREERLSEYIAAQIREGKAIRDAKKSLSARILDFFWTCYVELMAKLGLLERRDFESLRERGNDQKQPVFTSFAALALTILLAIIGVVFLFHGNDSRHTDLNSFSIQQFTTGLQQRHWVDLTTEVQIAMNEQTAFRQMSDTRIVLDEGQIWLEVQKEGKGFQVSNNYGLVTVQGTSFGVTQRNNTVEVQVVEGIVQFQQDQKTTTIEAGETIKIMDPLAAPLVVKSNTNKPGWVMDLEAERLRDKMQMTDGNPLFWNWALKPVLGWNSWDFYGTSVNEERIKAQADYMAKHMLEYGWELITVDIQWYQPTAIGFKYIDGAELTMDAYGRLTPAINRFPTASDGQGFKPLADYIHSKGLQFGIHLMRGVPRQAVEQDTPILGASSTASQIVDINDTCQWNPDMYGIDMSQPGSQEYYDSIFALYASWDVDFVKVDDLIRPYHTEELEAIRKAIDKTGRPIVLSISPGATPVAMGAHVMQNANQWRINDDFWDDWDALYNQFQSLHDWTPYRGPGYFPDADMLPLGKIKGEKPSAAGRATKFTPDEQYTLMSLWAIARSPLIYGGDMTQMDPFTLSLLTNEEVLIVNQDSRHNRQLYRMGDRIAWVADAEGSDDKFLALFNTGESAETAPVDLSSLGYTASVGIRSLWDHNDLGSFNDSFSPEIAAHGAGLYRLTGQCVPTPWITQADADFEKVELAWEPISTASSYQVKRAANESGSYAIIASGLTTPSYIDSAVTPNTTYYYIVTAIIDGKEAPDSGARLARILGPMGIVSWNFDAFGTVEDGMIAGVVPVANWNNSWPSNPLTNLADQYGNATTVDIDYSSFEQNSILPKTHPGSDADGAYNKEMLNSYLNSGSGRTPVMSSVVIKEIPYSNYDIYVYFSSDTAGRKGKITDGASVYSFSTIGAASISENNAKLIRTTNTGNGYPYANYAVFSGLSGDSKTIVCNIPLFGGIAAFQIVPDSGSDAIPTAIPTDLTVTAGDSERQQLEP